MRGISCLLQRCGGAAIVLLACLVVAGTASAAGNYAKPVTVPAYPCSGQFSDGTHIAPAAPQYLQDVPGQQFFCDFHTFAWNQFTWLIGSDQTGPTATPRFMQMAPWYNLLKPAGAPTPTAYPGGPTTLSTAHLTQMRGQADGDLELVDVAGQTVRYDIRFNQTMYDWVLQNGLWNEAGYLAACKANAGGNCTNTAGLFLPPAAAPASNVGALEVKTAWRDFGTAAACPATEYYCNGRFGLVGMHIVQKTQTHGEWIWASFEHVANAPDCRPSGDTPIAPTSPLPNTPWAFFNPATAGPGVMSSRICVVNPNLPAASQCNANPSLGTKPPTYKQVNVCRTDSLPPGGDSPKNCRVSQNGIIADANNGGNVACLNASLQPQMSGVWKNYKMIGSEWVKGTTPPNVPFTISPFQAQTGTAKLGIAVGFPNLANTTMETWVQKDDVLVINNNPIGPKPAGCFGCHNLAPSGTTVYTATTGKFAEDDFSHFPGKLPAGKLSAVLSHLLPADSTAKP